MEHPEAATSQDLVELWLISPGDHPELAAEYFSSKLWLDLRSAKNLVHVGHGLISQKVNRKRAQAEVALMAALGIEAKVGEIDHRNLTTIFDISVRRTRRSSIKKIKRVLKSIGLLQKVTEVDFNGPSGLEICGLTHKKVLKFAKYLQKIDGVTVTFCSQEAALSDVMAPPGLTLVEEEEIHHFATALGCGAISGHGMLATGMRRDQFAKLAERFPNARLTCANRAFERIDLYVTGVGTVSVDDFLKFTARYGLAAAKAASAGERHRIEAYLSRPEARLAFERLILLGVDFRAEWSVGSP